MTLFSTSVMEDNKCVTFLQWALPKLDLRWRGFRKVRRQVCKRIDRRIAELDLGGIESYQSFLEGNVGEWLVLDRLCRITISRFYRDLVVFDYFAADVFPALINSFREKNRKIIRVWSAGCASGEEPYTIAILWHESLRHQFPDVRLEIIATDIDPVMIKRAQRACYSKSSLRDLPEELIILAFDRKKAFFSLKQPYKKYVRFELLDIRQDSPGGLFQVILCRNLAFTYFAPKLQQQVLKRIHDKVEDGGVLIRGKHELMLPEGTGFIPWVEHMPIYQKV